MRAIRGKDTKPEVIVRKFLHAAGFRFRLHEKDLPGKPDIILPRYKTVIFVHGCFWHQHPGCKFASVPESNSDFWKKKLTANVERDQTNISRLKNAGWHCVVIWECMTKDSRALESITEELHNLTINHVRSKIRKSIER